MRIAEVIGEDASPALNVDAGVFPRDTAIIDALRWVGKQGQISRFTVSRDDQGRQIEVAGWEVLRFIYNHAIVLRQWLTVFLHQARQIRPIERAVLIQ